MVFLTFKKDPLLTKFRLRQRNFRVTFVGFGFELFKSEQVNYLRSMEERKIFYLPLMRKSLLRQLMLSDIGIL